MSDCERWIEIVDRQALGLPLDAQAEAFVREHPATCAACKREMQVWEHLGALAPAATKSPSDVSVQRILNEAGRQRRASRQLRVGVATMILAAAAIPFFLRKPSHTDNDIVATARAFVDRGELVVGGNRCAEGCEIPKGARIAASADACIRIEGGVAVCLAANSEATFEDAAMTHRRIFLSRGRAVASLVHQAEHASFAIGTSAGSVRAVGTLFAVVVASSVEMRVLEGTVAVEMPRGQEPVASPGAMNLATGERTELLPSTIEDDRRLLAGTPPASIASVPDAGEAPPPRTAEGAVDAAATPPQAPAPSVEALLSRARTARAASRFQEAALAYETLERTHASDPAARAALVSLGNLQLTQLGQPRAALASFAAYLQTGDLTLRPEALEGQIRALRALGRNHEEKGAIQDFLRLHPDDLRATSLRGRLAELDSSDAGSK